LQVSVYSYVSVLYFTKEEAMIRLISSVGLLVLLGVISSGCPTAIQQAACGTPKTVHLSKVLTPADPNFNLATPTTDSALLDPGCQFTAEIEYGFYSQAMQADAYDAAFDNNGNLKNRYVYLPLQGLIQRQFVWVDGSYVFNNWDPTWTVRNGTNIKDFYVRIQDHGSHPNESPNGVGIYSIMTHLSSVHSQDSSVWIDATITYYDGK